MAFTISKEVLRQLAKDLINCPSGGCWVDELEGTEDSLTEWLIEWFNERD